MICYCITMVPGTHEANCSKILKLESENAALKAEVQELELTVRNRTSVMDNNVKYLKTVEAEREKTGSARSVGIRPRGGE